LGLNLLPELLVRNAARFLDFAARFFENRLEPGRVSQEQPFQFVLIRDGQQHRDRLTVLRDNDRALLRLFQVIIEARFHIRDRGTFHSSTSSPAINRRFRSLTPSASTWTSRLSVLTL